MFVKGSYEVEIRSAVVSYKFVIRRKITVIRGDSGTGKTVLWSILESVLGIPTAEAHVRCAVDCVALDNGDGWRKKIESLENCIIFLDEDSEYMHSKNFASVVKRSSCYFVLITRRDLHLLGYSVSEIYGLREANEVRGTNKYNQLYPLYDLTEVNCCPDLLVVEDGKSGYDFYKEICDRKSDACVSARGNSNIIKTVQTILDSCNGIELLIVVDGASFGAYIDGVLDIMLDSKENSCYLHMEESFEYMILNSNMFSYRREVKVRVNDPAPKGTGLES